jgi:phosphoenolpyruvate synthase/pyruvate phosphate dikinase
MLDETFGPDRTYGVFVRSDTNVEDLPGFTGAGLNRTVLNVVGFENIVNAVREVWASPFTERAYGWRQSHMEQPEYVFPAVLIQEGFPAEKSGVMVTCDVDSGSPEWLSVAANEGVGGAVDGQAAESLRVRIETGDVELLAQATAPRRAVLSPQGGVERLPATGADAVLQPSEIDQLISFAKEVSMRFPELRTEGGQPSPADVEFAFRGGELALLQIRPFVESRNARRNQYLRRLDEGLRARGKELVSLDDVPSGRMK